MTRYVAAALLLTGCADIKVAPDSGREITLQHGSMQFNSAMQAVREHCAKLGLAARHVSTQGGGLNTLSKFQCIEK